MRQFSVASTNVRTCGPNYGAVAAIGAFDAWLREHRERHPNGVSFPASAFRRVAMLRLAGDNWAAIDRAIGACGTGKTAKDMFARIPRELRGGR